MKIEESLLEEHSRAQCDRIVAYIGKNPRRFAVLVKLFFNGDYRITQRAAWPLSYCGRKHPALIQPYFKTLLKNLSKPGIHSAVIRNTVRLLQDVEIPLKYQGQVMDVCFRFIESPDTMVAVKAFSLTILHKLSSGYPEIIPELKIIIADRWDFETPAFHTRAKKALKDFEKIKPAKNDPVRPSLF